MFVNWSIIVAAWAIFWPRPAASEDARIQHIVSAIQEEVVESLRYGVLFKKTAVLDLSASQWPHVMRVPRLPRLPDTRKFTVCERLPALFELSKAWSELNGDQPLPANIANKLRSKRDRICEIFQKVEHLHSELVLRTREQIDRQFGVMNDLVLPNMAPEHANSKRREITPAGLEEPAGRPSRELMNETLSRQKRLLQVIGETAGNWFGLATTADVRNINNAIGTIAENQERLKKDYDTFKKGMTTFASLQTTRMNGMARALNDTASVVNGHGKLLTDLLFEDAADDIFSFAVDEITAQALIDVSMFHDALLDYQFLLQEMIIALGWLNEHLLTPSLVTPDELNKTLTSIEKDILVEYPPFRFGFSSIDYFYRVPTTSYVADDDYLYIQIKVPLTVMDAFYHVYEVHSVPLATNKGTTQYTRVSNLPSYIAFSEQGDTYTTFSPRFLNACVGHGIKRCSSRTMEISTSVDSCVLGLFLNDYEMTKRFCHVDLILTPAIPDMTLDIGKGAFFVSAVDPTDKWIVTCPQSRPRTINPCKSCVIKLGCRCNLKTSSAFISASLQSCENKSSISGLSRSYVPNLMWIQRLSNFTSYNLTKFMTTTFLKYDPTRVLPELPIPEYIDVQGFIDSDKEFSIALDSVLRQVQDHQPVYFNKLQKYAEQNKLLFLENHHALPMSLASLVWNFAVTVTLVFILKRYYALYVMVQTVVESTPVHDKPPANDAWQATDYVLVYVTTVITVYLIFRIVKLILRWRQRRHQYTTHYPRHNDEYVTTQVLLKLWTGNKQVILHMDHLSTAQHFLTPVVPDNPDLYMRSVSRGWNMNIVIDWYETYLRHPETQLHIPLPTTVKVPRSIHFLVKCIMREKQYHVSLLLKTGIQQREIPIKTMSSSADDLWMNRKRGKQAPKPKLRVKYSLGRAETDREESPPPVKLRRKGHDDRYRERKQEERISSFYGEMIRKKKYPAPPPPVDPAKAFAKYKARKAAPSPRQSEGEESVSTNARSSMIETNRMSALD